MTDTTKDLIGRGPTVAAVVAEDGRFVFKGVPAGEYIVRLRAEGLDVTGSMALRSVSVSGRERETRVLTVHEGELRLDVELGVVPMTQTITGEIRAASPGSTIEKLIVLFPKNLESDEEIRIVQPDTDGAYVIENVAPGAFYFAVLDDVDVDRLRASSFLRSLISGALSVTVIAGEDLRLDVSVVGAS